MVIAAPALNFQPKQATLPVQNFLQRLLLVTQGKFTDIVRAYAGETVEAIEIDQKLVISDSRFSPLKLERQYQLLDRSTMLRGSQTKTNYLYANAHIVLDRLHTDLGDELVFGRQSLDKLLRENKVTAYREILSCGIEPAGSLGQYFKVGPQAELICRTYLVLIDGLPVMQIAEKFPTTHFCN